MAKRVRPVVKRRELDIEITRDGQAKARLKLSEALDKVINSMVAEGFRERTVRDYRRVWTWFFDCLNGELGENIRFVDQVTAEHFREYMAYCLTEEGHSPVTVNIRLRALKSMFNRMEREGIITDNPVKKVRRVKQDEKPIVAMTEEQFKRLIAQIDKDTFAGFRDYVAILTMYDTGMRINEINALEPTDIDFENSVIMLPGAKNKNRKTRAVPVSEEVLGLLKRLMYETQQYFGKVDRVFTNNFGEPLKDDLLRKRLYKYGVRAGLHGIVRVSPHTLRHSFAKLFILNGGDIFTLQKILGHVDITTTRKYIEVLVEDVVKAHKRYTPTKRLKIEDR